MTSSTMKAYAHTKTGGPEVLEILQLPKPIPTGHELLVKVHAVATNPVDAKLRAGRHGLNELPPGTPVDPPKIVGYDAAGVVEGVGPLVKSFKVGDEVYFVGVMNRQGANAEYTLVDERITGRKPKSLNWEQAAAVPLCACTAWEPLVEGALLEVPSEGGVSVNENKTILVVGGAGGLGSYVIQIAKKILRFGKVIATASRPDTVEWCKKLGADAVINHTNLKSNLASIGLENVHYVYVSTNLNTSWDEVVEVVKATGTIIGVTEFRGINAQKIYAKSLKLIGELVFTRAIHNEEPEKQGAVLNRIAEYIDKGVIVSAQNHHFDWNQIREAHQFQESGKAIGKITLNVKF